MQSDAPDPSTASTSTHNQPEQEPQDPSRTSKRQRLSSHPSPEPAAGDETAAASSSQQTLSLSTALTGSSRDTTEMHRSSTPPEASGSGAIKYTRTGRVSKATKGQRVHHCDECGKTYTRAEHLRRHQQNHKPGAFPCDIAGCGRSFHREDLLVRHKARHNDPNNPPSRRHSVGSQQSAPDASATASTSALAPELLRPPTSAPADRQPSNTSESQPHHPTTTTTARTPKRMIPPNELERGNVAIPVDGAFSTTNFTNPFRNTQPISPEYFNDYDYESSDDVAGLPYYNTQHSRPRYHSDASLLYAQAASSSRSPISSGSSSTYLPSWAASEAQYSGSVAAYVAHSLGHRQSTTSFPYEPSPDLAAEQRDLMEQNTFYLPHGFQERISFDDSSNGPVSPGHDLHLRAYWMWVHDLFPIIHRPTYCHETASSLLRTAILALGAQAAGDGTSASNARILHDKCLKVLRNRTVQNSHTYRVCDMQAILLVEVYATFKSRRPPLQFSQLFEDIFRRLSNDPEATMSAPSDTPTDTGSLAEDAADSGFGRIDVLSKQRLLLGCYLLEQQHNLLFGRSTTTCFGEIGYSLPFPSAQRRWDIPDYQSDFSDEATFDRLAEATIATSCMTEPALQPYDIFRSLLTHVRFCEATGDVQDFVESGATDVPILLATEQSSRGRLAYHTFMLCKTTPIRDLLAVAGESWIMAEKLSSQAEFTAAQRIVREWAGPGDSIANGGYAVNATKPAMQHALHHAVNILEIHQESPRCGLLFQEWSVYLAAIVIWARGYALRPDSAQPRLSIPNPNEPTRTVAGLDQAVTNIINAGSTGFLGSEESQNVLLWTKTKIEIFDIPHTCGLVSGALDVLGKLIMRGNQDHWF